MGEQAVAAMSVEEFYAWGERQDVRYEYVDGAAIRMMTGANRRHDDVVFNIVVALGMELRGKSCRGFTADTAVRTRSGRRRRPDAGVECGAPRDSDHEADQPKLVVEVLSPSTREFDLYGKLDEYKAVDSIDFILLVEPNAPEVMVWRRGANRAWEHETVSGLEAVVSFPAIGVMLRLADVYDKLLFPARPRLVPD